MAGPWEKYAQPGQPVPRAVIQGPPREPAPVNPAAEARDEARLGLSQQSAAREAARDDRTTQNTTFDNISKLRTEFTGLQAVKDFQVVLPQVASAMRIAENPNATGADDLALIYTFGKVMDPGSVVREGELALASGTGSFAQNLEGAIAKVRSGQKLPPEVRRNMVDAMRRRGIELAKSYHQARENYRFLAERQGLDPLNVIGLHPAEPFQQTEADYTGQTIRNYDQSIGAVPATQQIPQGVEGPTFRPGQPGDAPQPDSPLAPGPDGWVRAPYNPQVTPEQADIVRAKAEQMIRAGADYDSVAGFLVQNGISFKADELREGAAQSRGIITDSDSEALGLVKGALHPINRAAEGLQNAANAVFGTEFSGATDANQSQAEFFARNPTDPTAEMIGNIGGTVLATAPLRSATVAGAVGNVLAGDSRDAASIGADAVLGGIGGKAADMTIRGIAGAVAPRVAPEVRALHQEGVKMTPGQMAGGAMKRLEDRATSLPVVGGKVEASREAANGSFNIATANRALKPIGKTLPKATKPGHEAVKAVEETLSNEYQSVLGKMKVSLDQAFAKRVYAIRTKANLPPAQSSELDEIITRELTHTFGNGNAANGVAYKQLDEKLGDVAAGYLKSDDPYVRQLGKAVADVRDQVAATVRRQNPALADRLRKIDLGWAQYARIRSAAAMSPATGVFTPGQLRTAVRQLDRSRGKGATARGDALLQDIAGNASEVLPSSVGNSGTADRLATTNPFKWGAGAAMSPLYNQGTQNALAALLLSPRPAAAQGVANALRQLPAGAVGGAGLGMLLSPPGK